MRTFTFVKNGRLNMLRTYALGPGGRVITPADTGIEEITPAPDADTVIAAWKDSSGITDVTEVGDIPIPGDAVFRAAWKLGDGKVDVDMPKARAIHMNRIREARDKALAAKDREYMIADEKGRIADKQAIAAEKQGLRDIPQTFDLTVAQTPEELKALWPAELEDSRGA